MNARKKRGKAILLVVLFGIFMAFWSKPATAGYSISLSKNWNLVSLPEQPVNTDIAQVTSSINGKFSSIWSYVNGDWKVYDPLNPGFSDLTTMEAGPGYWVKMSETGTLSGSGSSPPKCFSLKVGWNLIGYNCEVSQPIEDVLKPIAGKYVVVWAYGNGRWKLFDPSNLRFCDFITMEPGFGYWINVTEATQLCITCPPPEFFFMQPK